MMTLTNHPIGTYAKALIQDWPTMADYILQKTQFVKDIVHAETSSPSDADKLLTKQSINDAFNGPFQTFFKCHLGALAKIMKATIALTLFKEDVLKKKDFDAPVDYGVPEYVLHQVEFSDLKKMKKTLDEHTQEHFAQWEGQIDAWQESLLLCLQQNNLPLNEIETQDFIQNEPITEINNRFTDLKIEIPKLKKDAFNFHQYFILKLTLTAHSALSRQHLSNTTKDISQAIQCAHPILKTIKNTEKELIEAQKKAIDEITAQLNLH